MPKYSTAFGMDVHLRSTTVCALDADTGEAVTRRFRGNPGARSRSGCRASPGRRSRPTRAATSASPRRGSSPGSASSASSPRSRRSPGRPPTRLQERQERRRQDGQGDTRPRHLPRMSPPPRSKASGTSPAPTTGRPRAWRPPSSGCSPSSQSGGSSTGGTTPRRQPEEVLDLRLPEVARQGQA